MRSVTRIIVDECVGSDSPLVAKFQAMLSPTQPVEFVRLAERHRAIPDVEVLRQVLGLDAVDMIHPADAAVEVEHSKINGYAILCRRHLVQEGILLFGRLLLPLWNVGRNCILDGCCDLGYMSWL